MKAIVENAADLFLQMMFLIIIQILVLTVRPFALFAIQEIQEKIAAITGLLLKRNSIFQAQIDTVAPDIQIPGLIKILAA